VKPIDSDSWFKTIYHQLLHEEIPIQHEETEEEEEEVTSISTRDIIYNTRNQRILFEEYHYDIGNFGSIRVIYYWEWKCKQVFLYHDEYSSEYYSWDTYRLYIGSFEGFKQQLSSLQLKETERTKILDSLSDYDDLTKPKSLQFDKLRSLLSRTVESVEWGMFYLDDWFQEVELDVWEENVKVISEEEEDSPPTITAEDVFRDIVDPVLLLEEYELEDGSFGSLLAVYSWNFKGKQVYFVQYEFSCKYHYSNRYGLFLGTRDGFKAYLPTINLTPYHEKNILQKLVS
jgi:hypothetical protein